MGRKSPEKNADCEWSRKRRDTLRLGDRCKYVAGDMFEMVPTSEAYIMKLIRHDWEDDECIQILQNQYRAAKSGGRVFGMEQVIPDFNTPHFSKLFDI